MQPQISLQLHLEAREEQHVVGVAFHFVVVFRRVVTKRQQLEITIRFALQCGSSGRIVRLFIAPAAGCLFWSSHSAPRQATLAQTEFGLDQLYWHKNPAAVRAEINGNDDRSFQLQNSVRQPGIEQNAEYTVQK